MSRANVLDDLAAGALVLEGVCRADLALDDLGRGHAEFVGVEGRDRQGVGDEIEISTPVRMGHRTLRFKKDARFATLRRLRTEVESVTGHEIVRGKSGGLGTKQGLRGVASGEVTEDQEELYKM